MELWTKTQDGYVSEISDLQAAGAASDECGAFGVIIVTGPGGDRINLPWLGGPERGVWAATIGGVLHTVFND